MQKLKFSLLMLVACSTVSGWAKASESRLHWFPKKAFPGGVVLIKFPISPEENEAIYRLLINQNEIPWALCPQVKERVLCAFMGVPLDETPVSLDVQVKKREAESGSAAAIVSIPIEKKAYKKSKLTVPPGHAEPSVEDKKRMEEERAVIKSVFQSGSKAFLWEHSFRFPGPGAPTSPFGNQRVFNGKVASTHYGVDLRGNEKTPVLSANAGKVAYAGNLFNAGNFVVVDHGGGIFTTYSHLSTVAVQLGDRVKPGQRLGQVGRTGRVTGPHLHWSVRIHDLYVDPLVFLKVSGNVRS